MEVTYILTMNDILRFDGFVIRRSTQTKIGLGLAILLAPLLASAFWLTQAQGWSGFFNGSGVSVVVTVVWGAIIFGARRGSVRARNAKFLGRKTARIGPDGFLVATDFVEIKYRWLGILEITEDAHCVFVLVDALTAIIIPKNAFGSHEQVAVFLHNARAYWTNPKDSLPNSLVRDDVTTWPPPPQMLT
jgi:hypothetical protein